MDRSLAELLVRTPGVHDADESEGSEESSEEKSDGDGGDYQETADDSTGPSAS